jgi:hypothetical protein
MGQILSKSSLGDLVVEMDRLYKIESKVLKEGFMGLRGVFRLIDA